MNNFYEEIKNIFDDDLDRKTLEYRINCFIHACDIDLTESNWEKIISEIGIPYINKTGSNHNISFAKTLDRRRGKNAVLIGKYRNLDFCFINYFGWDNKKRQIIEYPYSISLAKYIKEKAYCLKIDAIDTNEIKVNVIESSKDGTIKQEIEFSSKYIEFNKVLKFIKGFVNNPELIFDTYDRETNNDFMNILNKVSIEDDELNKPEGMLKKLFKKLHI
jgi:hypothetical protein